MPDLADLRAAFDDLVAALLADIETLRAELALVTAQRDELRALLQPPRQSDEAPHTIVDIQRMAILEALTRAGGVQRRAAAALGMTPRVLNYRMKQFGLVSRFSTQKRRAVAGLRMVGS